MKIVLTGNASADYFYPLIAVAENINKIIDDKNLADTQLYFISNKPFDKKALYENGISFKKSMSAKSRFGLSSIIGTFQSLVQIFSIFPDVIFSTGGHMSYPTLWAAKILKIPIIIHESNSIPNDTNLWIKDYARAITVSYKQEVDFFDSKKIIHLGQPIRQNLKEPSTTGAYEFLNLERDTPVIWILSGTNGSKNINRVIEESLPELLNDYQIVHQTGYDDYQSMKMLTDATLINHNYKYRYHAFDFLNQLSMKMLAGVTDIIISRAGSTLFEIAHWEIPAIIIPMTKSHGNHQIKNAYNYAREGGCIVIEENNLNDQGLIFEINRIFNDEKTKQNMRNAAKKFALPHAGREIAEEIIGIALNHEK